MRELVVIQFLFLSAAVFGAGVCYKPYGTDVVTQYEVSNLLITVNWIEEAEDGADAWSECSVDVEKDIGWCEIWVRKPKSVLGDPDMDALGHEVLHGLIGDFHPEDNE